MKNSLKTLNVLISIIVFSVILNFNIKREFSYGNCGMKSLISICCLYDMREKSENVKRFLVENMQKNNKGKISTYDVSYSDLKYACGELGFKTSLFQANVFSLRKMMLKGILHVDGDHFVALVGQDSQTFHIMETGYEGPPRLERWTDGDLMARWDGIILVISKPEKGTIPRAVKPTPPGDSHGKPN